MAMWLIEPGWQGWSTWSGAAAVATGLHYRPWEALLADLPAWEREHHLNRPARPAPPPAANRNSWRPCPRRLNNRNARSQAGARSTAPWVTGYRQAIETHSHSQEEESANADGDARLQVHRTSLVA